MAYDELVLVAAHGAIKAEYGPGDLSGAVFERGEYWAQNGTDEAEMMLCGQHFKAALDYAATQGSCLVVLDAGYTRPESVGGRHDWSDAYSYLVAGAQSGWYDIFSEEDRAYITQKGQTADLRLFRLVMRGVNLTVAISEYARYSLEEQLVGLLLYETVVGDTPKAIREFGWEFKRNRIVAHAAALGVPEGLFAYVGVNNPPSAAAANRGEDKTLQRFAADPLGMSSALAEKRRLRDPLERGNPYTNRL